MNIQRKPAKIESGIEAGGKAFSKCNRIQYTANPRELILGRLSKVKQSGANRWTACCPAHEDRSPSLSITECDDGRILIHDFAGCTAEDIVSAIGLTMADLFPPRPDAHRYPKQRNQIPARDVLYCLRQEALIVLFAGRWQLDRNFSEKDYSRLEKAVNRIDAAVNYIGGGNA